MRRLERMLACLLLLVAEPAFALNLTADAQLGVSKAPGPGERWTVWARRSDGQLISRHDSATSGFRWDIYSGIPLVDVKGVTATGWTAGGVAYEKAYYLGGGVLNEIGLHSDFPDPEWSVYALPANTTLSGHMAATTTLIGGVRQTVVFATSTTGVLWALIIDADTGDGLWSNIQDNPVVDATTPLAASSSPDGSTARVFARKGNRLWMERLTAAGFDLPGFDLGRPTGGYNVCGTMAAAEGHIGTTYYIHLFWALRHV